MTCFLLDAECRLHTSRIKAAASFKDRDHIALRRKLARRATGQDLLLSVLPTIEAVTRWRFRLLSTPVAWMDEQSGRERTLPERQAALAEAYAKGIPAALAAIRDEIEAQSTSLAVQLGQYPEELNEEDLSPLSARNTAMSDGTWVKEFSGAELYQLRESDPVTGELVTRTKVAGSRARSDRSRRISTYRLSHKAHGPATGVLHTALVTRSLYGRIIHTIDRTFGGEVQAALEGFGRVAPRIPGRIRALAYDKAFEGWNGDVLTARYGAVPIVPPKAEVAGDKSPDNRAAAALAKEVLEEAFWAGLAETRPNGAVPGPRRAAKKPPKKAPTPTDKVKYAVAARILSDFHADLAERIAADAQAGLAVGRGLPPGRSAYLSSNDELVLVESVTKPFRTRSHTVAGKPCKHRLVLDDSALWSTGLERGNLVKEQRLGCVRLERLRRGWSGWYELKYTYQFTCEATGEILIEEVWVAPDGTWRPEGKTRKVKDDLRLVAPCDPTWRPLYGLRNDCESWFSWLKNQFPQGQRAASLDLNHQFLDVLHAAMLTNSITRFHYLMEGGC